MIHKARILSIAMVAALAMLLAACGTSGGTAGGELTQNDAAALSGFAGSSVALQMDLLENPVALAAFIGSTSLGTAQTQCYTITETGDTDGDGIPDQTTATYNCNQADDGFDATGTITVTDTGNGVNVVVDNVEFGSSAQGSSFTFTYDGTASTTANTSTGVYTANIDLTFGFTADGESASFSIDFSQTFTSNSTTSDDFASGTLEYSGTISVSDSSSTYTLDVATTPNFQIDSTCSSDVRSGSAEYSDSAGNTATVSYSNCNPSLLYNGSPI